MLGMLKFKVSYYDDDHRRLLQSASCAKALDRLVQNGLEVSEAEFLAYTVFREQKSAQGFQTFGELKRKVRSRRVPFEDYFDISARSVYAKFTSGKKTDKSHTEAAGVGAALSLVSRLYGLTEADWQRISEGKVKTLDFEIAATDKEFVEVEAKGSVVPEDVITPSVSNQKRDIKEKKAEQRARGNTHTLIGVITTFPKEPEDIGHCRVLDPTPIAVPREPFHYRLLARLYFYWRELSLISRTHVLSILYNRIRDLSLTAGFERLDGRPLLNRKGEEHFPPTSVFESRSVAGDREAFGEVFRLGGSKYFFYGLQPDVLPMLIEQDFARITDFQWKPRDLGRVPVLARLPWHEMPGGKADEEGKEKPLKRFKGRSDVPMRGRLFITPAGRVIGEVSPTWQIG